MANSFSSDSVRIGVEMDLLRGELRSARLDKSAGKTKWVDGSHEWRTGSSCRRGIKGAIRFISFTVDMSLTQTCRGGLGLT